MRASLDRALRNFSPEEDASLRLTPREIGEALFKALFSGQVGGLWERSLGMLRERGLRLQLRLNLDGGPPASSILHSYPWELLYQPDTRDFLALSRLTPVVRHLEVPRPMIPLRRPPVLRILGVLAKAPGLAPLNLERERQEIEQAWGHVEGAEIAFLKEARPEALRRTLVEGEFHVLHFMGHGTLDRTTGEGLLYFVRDRDPDPVSGESLATLLKDVKSLRLVFLNACETAQARGEDGCDPFAGVAAALILGGLPAVIAMQLPISDPAAITFSRTVYLRLADGDPVDAAVTEGRQALFSAAPRLLEWAIPVLFTRTPDGRLFEPRTQRPRDTVTRPISRPAPPRWTERLRSRGALLATAAVLAVGLSLLALTLGDRLLFAIPWPAHRPVLETAPVGAFRIARHEVSQRAFRQFVLANPDWRRGRIASSLQDGDYLKSWISWHEVPPAVADHPVTHVSWYAARAFCAWMGGRLPSRAEWQTAAHAGAHRFPWGTVTAATAILPLNFCDRDCLREHRDPQRRDGFPETAPVTAFPAGATPEGVLNLSGNVWEWCSDASGTQGVTMGGSYLARLDECSTDKASWEEATLCAPDGGFRCAWDGD